MTLQGLDTHDKKLKRKKANTQKSNIFFQLVTAWILSEAVYKSTGRMDKE